MDNSALITGKFDLHDFLRTGLSRLEINQTMADFLLRHLKRAPYLPQPADHCDAGPRFRADIGPDHPVQKILENLWIKIQEGALKPLLDHYRNDPKDCIISVLRLDSGYSLDWHNHLSSGGTASFLLYLFDDQDSARGGDLVIGEYEPNMADITEIARVSPRHGSIALIGDASHPLQVHKAEHWTGNGSRYLIAFAFNATDW